MSPYVAVMVDCSGEAHSNAYIDNCGMCSPYWGRYPTCPRCHTKLGRGDVCRNEACEAAGTKFLVPGRY